MPPDPTQPTTPPEPAVAQGSGEAMTTQTPAEPQSAPAVVPEPTPATTEAIPASTADSTATNMPPEAPEAPRTLETSISNNVPEPIPTTPERQNPPSAPVSAPVEPPPAPVPAPQPVVVIQQANPRSFLAKALEKIQFRKRAKLEKIVKLATEKKSVTNDQVQKLLYVSDATASRYLAQLVRDGKLRKLGPDGRARYEPVSGSLPTN